MANKVSIIMGSDSDYENVKPALTILNNFDIEYEIRVISAHRSPEILVDYVKNAKKNNIKVIIGAAGKAAHLPGVIASYTTLPVIGIPIKSSTMDGLDSLLSIVQMPSGIPVATMAIDGSENAALFALQIIALENLELEKKLIEYRKNMTEKVIEKDKKIQNVL